MFDVFVFVLARVDFPLVAALFEPKDAVFAPLVLFVEEPFCFMAANYLFSLSEFEVLILVLSEVEVEVLSLQYSLKISELRVLELSLLAADDFSEVLSLKEVDVLSDELSLQYSLKISEFTVLVLSLAEVDELKLMLEESVVDSVVDVLVDSVAEPLAELVVDVLADSVKEALVDSVVEPLVDALEGAAIELLVDDAGIVAVLLFANTFPVSISTPALTCGVDSAAWALADEVFTPITPPTAVNVAYIQFFPFLCVRFCSFSSCFLISFLPIFFNRSPFKIIFRMILTC